ncbi:hypothetical protein GPECTOR_444g330 [Gonium pectorale]|uniref:Uncharacterized protein n=1 Tax=Gonium pectorale TaxID=33097 RepID=A0A150FV73_GONPE|nr:hypothetical protein GPECTOR_444g330 [Gonium pectorale]|eukprot:KXZ41478.1 hypothetical protein GPECTOR_444g330 [Gonium pectorale]
MPTGLTAFDLMELKHNIVLWCTTNDVPVSGPDDHRLFTQFMKFVPPSKPFSGSLLRIWEEVKWRSDADTSLNPMVMLWREIGRQHSAELRAATRTTCADTWRCDPASCCKTPFSGCGTC